MKRLLAVLAAFVLIAATTSPVDNGYPPDRYQGDRTVTAMLVQNIMPPCGLKPTPKVRWLACEINNKLVLPNPCSDEYRGEDYARLVCHELGHANGWPGDHPRP